MIDEKLHRRPGFDEASSTPVVMPGGATLFLPKPHVRLRPVFRAGKRADDLRLCTDDPEFDRLKQAVIAASADDAADFTGAVLDLAAHMILTNYDLTDDQLGDVFAEPMDTAAANPKWMSEVMAVAHGKAPHSFSDGSASA